MNETDRRNYRRRGKKLLEDIESIVDEAMSAASSAVAGGAETIRDNFRDTVGRVRTRRDNVVMVRVDTETLGRLDELLEAGVVTSRSEAAAFLIVEGVKARRDLFDKIATKVDEIRRAKDDLKRLLEDDGGEPQQRPAPEAPADLEI